jgi:electron transfer flavoprotein beta subunit
MRKIMVCVKRVIDYNVRVRVKPDGSGVITDGVKMSINPFDEIALEEALRLGPDDAQQQLRTALAMGADRAVLIKCDAAVEPLVTAQGFLALVQKETPELVILGKQAIDDDAAQTGPMLAALWGRPQATAASKVEARGDTLVVTREVDAGLEVNEIDLPGVLTVDLRLNEPRYVKLPDIMKAKKKPLDVTDLAALGVVAEEHARVLNWEPPAQRQKGAMLKDAGELVEALKKKGLV